MENISIFDTYVIGNNAVSNYNVKEKYNFKFIDLFAGIGGFHIAMEELGGECVFAAEWNENCRKTYTANFSKTSPKIFNSDGTPNKYFCEDITKFDPKEIPDHDVLCAGFPCQPFRVISNSSERSSYEQESNYDNNGDRRTCHTGNYRDGRHLCR